MKDTIARKVNSSDASEYARIIGCGGSRSWGAFWLLQACVCQSSVSLHYPTVLTGVQSLLLGFSLALSRSRVTGTPRQRRRTIFWAVSPRLPAEGPADRLRVSCRSLSRHAMSILPCMMYDLKQYLLHVVCGDTQPDQCTCDVPVAAEHLPAAGPAVKIDFGALPSKMRACRSAREEVV